MLHGHAKSTSLLFRCAHHLSHDYNTAVLKPCITFDARKIIKPKLSLLDPRGVFVLKVGSTQNNAKLFVWQGVHSSSNAFTEAMRLAGLMFGILTPATCTIVVPQYSETAEFLSSIIDDGPFSSSSVAYDDLYLAEAIVISRTSTPQQKVRLDQVAPVTLERVNVSGINLDFSKDVDIFVKVKRNSRTDSTSATSTESDASALPGILSAVLSAGYQADHQRSKSHKRQADEMEVDNLSPDNSTTLDIDGFPSPKYQNSDPSSSVDLTDAESFRNFGGNSINALNSSITSCKLDGSIDSLDSNFGKIIGLEDSCNMSVDIKSSDGVRQQRNADVSLNFATAGGFPKNSKPDLTSIVSNATEIQPASVVISSCEGKYEMWSASNDTSAAESDSSLYKFKMNYAKKDARELHPDHVDSPHIVTVHVKPLLYLATPSTELGGGYLWLPMGVYDDEDLQEVRDNIKISKYFIIYNCCCICIGLSSAVSVSTHTPSIVDWG